MSGLKALDVLCQPLRIQLLSLFANFHILRQYRKDCLFVHAVVKYISATTRMVLATVESHSAHHKTMLLSEDILN